MRAWIVLGVAAALVLGWTGSAAAEKKRVGVPKFDGPQEAVIRKTVMQVLKGQGYEVLGSRELDASARNAGVQLDSNDGFKQVAKDLSIASFVTGEVGKKKARLTVRNGSDGAVSGEGSFAGPNPSKVAGDVRDNFVRRLGSAIDRGKVPSGSKKPKAPVAEADEGDEAPSASDEQPTSSARKSPPVATKATKETKETKQKDTAKDSDDKEDKDDKDATPPAEAGAKKAEPAGGEGEEGEAPTVLIRALDLGVGFRGFTRSLTYNQDIYRALRGYKLALGPAVVASITAYPGAFFSSGIPALIGFQLDLEQALGVASNVPAGTIFPMGATFPTIIHDFSGALRGRWVFDGGHEVALLVGGGEHAFSFRSSGGADRGKLDIPDTIYRYVRVGADVRLELPSNFTATIGAGYRIVGNQGGQIASFGFFPFLTVAGIDANVVVGYHITPSIEARVGLDLRRYFYAMNSDKSDLTATPPNRVAGGAVDQYLSGSLMIAYVFGSASSASGGDESEEAPPPEKKKKKKGGDEDADEGGSGGGAGSKGAGGGDDSSDE
jgi:hypothetical protein